MKCTRCSKDVPAGASFCPQCGSAVQGTRAGTTDQQNGAARMQAAGTHGSPRDTPEEELWEGAYSPQAMIGPFIGAALLTIIGMIVASIAGPPGWAAIAIVVAIAALIFSYLGLLLLYRRMTVYYRLTSHRLLIRRGILNRIDDRMLLVDIDDITVRQGLIERMFNVGTITLNTTDKTTNDKTGGVLPMLGIENPRQVGDVIDDARRAERSRRGLYMMNA